MCTYVWLVPISRSLHNVYIHTYFSLYFIKVFHFFLSYIIVLIFLNVSVYAATYFFLQYKYLYICTFVRVYVCMYIHLTVSLLLLCLIISTFGSYTSHQCIFNIQTYTLSYIGMYVCRYLHMIWRNQRLNLLVRLRSFIGSPHHTTTPLLTFNAHTATQHSFCSCRFYLCFYVRLHLLVIRQINSPTISICMYICMYICKFMSASTCKHISSVFCDLVRLVIVAFVAARCANIYFIVCDVRLTFRIFIYFFCFVSLRY